MNRRKFVVTSTISMLAITIAVVGLAYYSDFAARAFHQNLPEAINYLPADTQAVFGMNVQKFIASPVYSQIMEKHSQEIGTNLAEFIDKTGVDPRRDLDYIIGAGRASQQKGAGVIIAVGRFNPDQITAFINSQAIINNHTTPIKLDYNGATVLMIPETSANGAKLEKGIAFLNNSQIVLGDLESIHAVLDAYKRGPVAGSNANISAMVANLDPKEMFWFAGDATVLAKVPPNTPFLPSLSAIQNVFGTLDLTTTINGRVTVTARDATAAGQLADFARGLVALGNLAGSQNPDLAALVAGVHIVQNTQNANRFDITLTVPIDLLQKLEATKSQIKAQMK
ncbi:MAG: hypothetical protein LAP85_24020 [Acidobacteriia bacterium]|nr:hypothetical protein [Terriglobia bacterium]